VLKKVKCQQKCEKRKFQQKIDFLWKEMWQEWKKFKTARAFPFADKELQAIYRNVDKQANQEN